MKIKKPAALICDSDRHAILTCEQALKSAGFDVQVAECGMTALARLRASCPEVVILGEDLQWGGAQGILDWLDERDPKSELPHVLLTGSGSSYRLSEEYGLPINQCLEKPLTRWTVMNAVSWVVTRPAKELAAV